MIEDTSNDNDHATAAAPSVGQDAPAQAAILLIESLIHGLVARSVLSVEEAIEIVNVAAQVVIEIDESAGGPSPTSRRSVTILEAIAASLAIDSNVG